MKALFCLCDNKGTLCPVHNFDDFVKSQTTPATMMILMLNKYIREWKALDSAQDNVGHWPIISFIRFHRILTAKHRLTKKFESEINALQKLNK